MKPSPKASVKPIIAKKSKTTPSLVEDQKSLSGESGSSGSQTSSAAEPAGAEQGGPPPASTIGLQKSVKVSFNYLISGKFTRSIKLVPTSTQ